MPSATPHRVGLYLAVVQFFFAVTWTVYVIFLPQLAAQAGIPKQAVILILMMDQAIFAVMDYATGAMADRVAGVVGRLGRAVVAVTLASCIAFLLLPLAAPQGAAWLFLVITVVWSATSSVLRAPPLVLLGKHASASAVPWLSALSLFGLGAAGAVGPYLTVALREADPRLPFALSSVALALVTLGIVRAERALAGNAAVPARAVAAKAKRSMLELGFLAAIALVALGFQIHFALNSAPLYLRFAKPPDLQYLMPVFWIGFNLLMLPATWATRRYGGLAVMGAGGLLAAAAAVLAQRAGSLEALVVLQFVAGGGWGCVLMSAVSAALAIGYTGREGRLTGALFALLALATFARMAMVATELTKDPAFASALLWIPAVTWALGAVLALALLPAALKLARS